MEHLIWILREGRIPCLFHELTGFYCPGCGGTRAVLALLAGHPILSFLYHPLGVIAVVLGIGEFVYFMSLSSLVKDPANAALINEFMEQLEQQLQQQGQSLPTV